MSSLLYRPNFKSSEAELRNNHTDFMDSNIFQQQPPQPPPQQQQQSSAGIMRYRSAPSSFLMELMDNNGGGGCEDFRFLRPSSPEVETVLASFMSSCNDGPDQHENGGNSLHHQFEERAVKQEAGDPVSKQRGYSNSSHMMYQASPIHNSDSSFGSVSSTGLESSIQVKMGGGNRSNLARQCSSPAGFFPNVSVDNGFNLMKEGGSFRGGNSTNGESSPSTSRLNNQLNFSSGSSSYLKRMPRIAENGNENIEEGGLPDHSPGNPNSSNAHFVPSFPNDTWDNSSFNDIKRARNNEGNKFSTSTTLENQNNDFGQRSHGLTHHLSLPNRFEMPAGEKFLHFEDSIPCKIRAKRGFATHPRSIAERMRRTRISERMKKLQDLFPNMDKQINTAEMLDLSVEYIKDLQKQVKTLSDARKKCSCSSK